ncbi:Protein of uncharacterised function (DUF1441) [Escherichia coli]|nr:Protein of uncharacterised function (DUF1441) [Escherichia coli]VWM79003.1 Protein of uncharacterised function (DUF1441) [Escherichia coli]
MDRELKNLTLNISQLAALSGVHRQTAAARLQNLPVAGGHESNLKLYRVVDIVSAFLALPPPVAEGEMDAHERKAWYQSERERLKFEQETAQLIPASDVRREFAIWAKAVVQVLETLPDNLISLICFSLLLSNSSSSVAATSPRIWANTRLPLPFPT